MKLTSQMRSPTCYVKRRGQAEAAREFGRAAELDTVIADETKHRDELRQMLARWP
jgi:hypothetical protein